MKNLEVAYKKVKDLEQELREAERELTDTALSVPDASKYFSSLGGEDWAFYKDVLYYRMHPDF